MRGTDVTGGASLQDEGTDVTGRAGLGNARARTSKRRTTCRRCGSALDANGYCTKATYCPYEDRSQSGSPPGPRAPKIAGC